VELKGTFMSLDLDESTDIIDDKQVEINVRCYNESKREVVTDFLSVNILPTQKPRKLQIT